MASEPTSLYEASEALSAKSLTVKVMTKPEEAKSMTFQISESERKYSLP